MRTKKVKSSGRKREKAPGANVSKLSRQLVLLGASAACVPMDTATATWMSEQGKMAATGKEQFSVERQSSDRKSYAKADDNDHKVSKLKHSKITKWDVVQKVDNFHRSVVMWPRCPLQRTFDVQLLILLNWCKPDDWFTAPIQLNNGEIWCGCTCQEKKPNLHTPLLSIRDAWCIHWAVHHLKSICGIQSLK